MPTFLVPERSWSWSMYSKRRSARRPGSVHTPCAFQLVLTMQNAEPQEAVASAAAPIDNTTANNNRFISLSIRNFIPLEAHTEARGHCPVCGELNAVHVLVKRQLEESVRLQALRQQVAHPG